jgi:H+-translocating NAD(P) transhydrogenase subunit alpha
MTEVFVPRERRPGETRVAAIPETVKRLIKEGLTVTVEAGAGAESFFSDAQYEAAGARLTGDPRAAWSAADVVLKVAPPAPEEVAALAPGALLIGLLSPYGSPEMVQDLAARQVSALAMELVPRISRAQTMDALSSQASIAGYKAVLMAAERLPKYFPLLMTAAGTVPPAKVVVMGAGVAGLQAIATAKRLGATVEVSDIRPAVKEQVESLGARFIELPMQESGEGAGGYAREMGEDFLRRQREIVTRHLAAADVVITTALIPGRPAPRLVTREMVDAMHPGAVIVDLAIEQGGNCELSQADREVVHGDVLIVAPSNLAAGMPHDASLLYARNVLALLLSLVKNAEDAAGAPPAEGATPAARAGGAARGIALDTTDEVVAGTLLTHGGAVVHPAIAKLMAPIAPMAPTAPSAPPAAS